VTKDGTRYGAVAGGPISSRVEASDPTILPVAAALDPAEATLLPAMVQILRAVETIPEPGWTAVVASGGVRAEVLLALLPSCGVRRTVRVTMGDDTPGPVAVDTTVNGSRAEWREELGSLLRDATTPVVAFEARGDVATQVALLGTLPPLSRLVLVESVFPAAPATVDSYRLVHRKNTIIHGVPRFDPQDGARCERALGLLRGRVSERWRPSPSVLKVQAGLDPARDAGDLLLLVWPE
jgi:hypothetical protein